MKGSAGKRVLMLLENSTYPNDARVRMEATSLSTMGYLVSVVCPRGRGQKWREELHGVAVYRFPRGPEVAGVAGIILEYLFAMFGALALSGRVLFDRGFDVVHAHNPPDTFVLIALLYKLVGKKFIFDHHDLCPEMYCAKFGRSPGGPLYDLLRYFERLSFTWADHVISTNESYRRVAIERGAVQPHHLTVVRNGPELDRVREVLADPFLRSRARSVIGYVGVLGFQDGVDYLLRALAHLRHELGRNDFFCVIVGKGDALSRLRHYAKELCIDDVVELTGYIPDEQLMRYLCTTDICVDPDPSNPFNDSSSMIKMTEYMALGKPIVAFDLPEHRVTAGEAALYALPNDEHDFARKLATLMDSPETRSTMGRIGRERVRDRFAWVHQEANLVAAYESLLGVPEGTAARFHA